jgi:hypothetical protein
MDVRRLEDHVMSLLGHRPYLGGDALFVKDYPAWAANMSQRIRDLWPGLTERDRLIAILTAYKE